MRKIPIRQGIQITFWLIAFQATLLLGGTRSAFAQDMTASEVKSQASTRVHIVDQHTATNACPQVLTVSPQSLTFHFLPSSGTPAYTPQTFTMTHVYPDSLSYSPNEFLGVPAWLSYAPHGLAGPGTLTFSVDPTGLAPGTYTVDIGLLIRWEIRDDLRCDDGSYFGGYDITLRMELVVADCTPHIAQTRQVGGIAQRGKRYAVAVSVKLPETCPAGQEITVSGGETEAKLNEGSGDLRGDALITSMLTPDGTSDPTQTIQPGEVKEFTFEAIHDWDWTGFRDQTCAHLFVPDLLISRLPLVSNVKDLIDVIDEVSGESDLVRWRTYGMQFTASNTDGKSSEISFSPNDSRAARVEVRLDDLVAYTTMIGSIKTSVLSTGVGIGSVIASGGVATPVAIGAFAVEGTLFVGACMLFDAAVGNVSAAVHAPTASPELPSLEAAPDSAGKDLALALLAAQENRDNLYTSLEAYEAAPLDSRDELLAEVQTHLAAYQASLSEIQELTDPYITEVEATNVVMNETTLAEAKTRIETEGLPEIERAILAEYGLSEDDIDRLTQMVLQELDSFPMNWQEAQRQYGDWATGLATVVEEHLAKLQHGQVGVFLPVIHQ